MKKLIRIKSIRIKKPDLSGVRKEWSLAYIRQQFCYRPMLWLGLPIMAALSFAIIYVMCLLCDFEVVPWRHSLAMAATSAVGYFIGMLTLAQTKLDREEEEAAGEKATLISKVIASAIGVVCVVVLLFMEADEIVEDRTHWIETVGTVLTIISSVLPVVLSKVIYR